MFSNNFLCSPGGGFIGGEISRWYGTSAMGTNIDPGIDYNPNSTVLFPFLSDSGQSRWAFLINTGATTATINVTPNTTTTYTVVGTGTNGCSASATHTVTVNPLPLVTASSSSSIDDF